MTDEQREAARVERRDVIESNKAWTSAETVRRDWLRGLATRKTAPKGTATFIATALAHDADLLADIGGNHLAAGLLGVTSGAYGRSVELATLVERATDARALLSTLVMVLAAYEARTDRNDWRTPAHRQAATSPTFRPSDTHWPRSSSAPADPCHPLGPPDRSARRPESLSWTAGVPACVDLSAVAPLVALLGGRGDPQPFPFPHRPSAPRGGPVPTYPRAADLDPDHLRMALMSAAAGDRSSEAAILLLAEAGHWLPQLAAAGLVTVDGSVADVADSAAAWATITWADLDSALQAGWIFGSSGQLRLLHAAASLANGQLVDLSDIATGLDDRHLTMVLVAITRAGGMR